MNCNNTKIFLKCYNIFGDIPRNVLTAVPNAVLLSIADSYYMNGKTHDGQLPQFLIRRTRFRHYK